MEASKFTRKSNGTSVLTNDTWEFYAKTRKKFMEASKFTRKSNGMAPQF
jgi:hypothetical protein